VKKSDTERLVDSLARGLGFEPGSVKGQYSLNLKRDGRWVAELIARRTMAVLYLRNAPSAKLLRSLKLEASPAPQRADGRPAAATPKWTFRLAVTVENATPARSLLEAVLS
jgi:hypothetical protein